MILKMKSPVKVWLIIYQYWSWVNKISGSVFNPGRYFTTRYELQDIKNTSGRLIVVIRRDTLLITPVSTSDDSSLSFLEGSSGRITTQNKEQSAEEKMLIPL